MTNDIQIAVRLPSYVVSKLDALANEMSAKTPGVKVSRAAVLRMLAMRGIDEINGSSKVRVSRKPKKSQ